MTTNFTNKNISSIQINGENFNLKGVPFHGTEAEWNEISYTPKAGEIVVYDIDELHDYQRIKFGDGISIVSTLPFWQAGEVENIEIDTTLTQSGMAADAKTVGDAIILKANKLDLVQSNWNENDETALDYIKNRTHYTENIYELLREGEFKERGPVYAFDIMKPLGRNIVYRITLGDKYCYDAYGQESDEYSCTLSLVPYEGHHGLTLYYEELSELNNDMLFINKEVLESAGLDSYYIKIETKIDENVYQLDEKYIPDTIARKSDVAQADWNQNDESAPDYIKNRPFYEDENKVGAGDAFSDRCTITSTGIDNLNSVITERNETPANGQRFYVLFDDAEYPCEVETIVIDSEGNTEQCIGNKSIRNPDLEDTGEPFYAACTYWGRYVFLVYAHPGNHIFQVFEEGSAVQCVNEKFIPKTIARLVDIPRQQNANWDMNLSSHVSFIHNRPFYDNNTITEQVLFTELDIMPNTVPSIDVNYRIAHGLGWVYMVTFDSVDYYIQPLYCDNNEENKPYVYLGNASLISPNLMNTGEPFCLKYKGTGSHSGTIYVYADSGMHTIYVQKVDFKQLDEKFIPSTIARTKDIPKQVQADFEAKQDEKGHILNRPMNRTVNYTNVIENVDVGSYCIYDFRNYPGSNYKNYLTVEGLADATSEISYALTYEGMTSRGWYELNFNFYGFKPFDGVNLKQTINSVAARLTEIYCVQDYTLLSDELKEKMPHNGVWIVVTGTEAKDNLRNFTLKQYYHTKLSANYLPKETVMQKVMENYVDNALANVPKQILLVNVSTTYSDSGEITYSADKTIDEMLEAIQAGIPIVCMYGRQECSLNSYSTNKRYISFVFHAGGRTNSLMCDADEWTLNPIFDAANASMFPIEAKPGQVLVVDTLGHGGIAKLKTIDMPSGGESYELPAATAETLGGIKADPAEEADTQPVRIGGDGKLYTAPGAGGNGGAVSTKWKLLNDITVSEVVDSVTIDADSDGKPISARHMIVHMYLPKYDYNGETSTGYSTYAVNGKKISKGNGYCYPASGWADGYFLFDIMACGDLVYVRCYKESNGSRLDEGRTVDAIFHFAINENIGLYDAITSFTWSLFNRKVLIGSTFKVYGEVV